MPDEYLDWKIVFDTGWTLEQVRAMSMQDVHDYIQIIDARTKAGIK
jgi:hypothetical protein